jgi:hypothetical protein
VQSRDAFVAFRRAQLVLRMYSSRLSAGPSPTNSDLDVDEIRRLLAIGVTTFAAGATRAAS